MKCPTCEYTINWVSLRKVAYYNDGYAYTPCPDCGTPVKCSGFPKRNSIVKEDDETSAN